MKVKLDTEELKSREIVLYRAAKNGNMKDK
jgi:hypothetical protein